jgi:ATP-dependent DNA helicase RecG
LRSIAQLELNKPAITHGKIVAMGTKWFRQHTKSIFEIILDDGTARLHCRWWNLPYMEKYFKTGDEVLAFGKPVSLKPRVIDHAETEVLEGEEENFIHLNRLTPIYPLTEGLPQRWLRSLIWRTLNAFESQIHEPHGVQITGCKMSVEIQTGPRPTGGLSAESSFPSRAQAVRMLHFPDNIEDTDRARRRLALDEFIELQTQMLLRRRNFETKAQALPCPGDNRLIKPFLAGLGFKLTKSQTQVLQSMRKDMAGPHPMRRLLQGDVGSGKTVVAACCALMALESGYDVALMVPTEILADQHFLTFSKWLRPLGITVALRTGSRREELARDKTSVISNQKSVIRGQPVETGGAGPGLNNAENRTPTLTVGTHALIEAGFTPEDLGLVIIDEQHKFGVAQRQQFLRKGHYPHLLVLTATPIPRTLGLTLYGDLDISLLTEAPAGRGKIRTFVRTADKLPNAFEFICSKLSEGRQAYVVYPRVEETGENGIKAVTKEFENLRKTLAPFRVGLLHGRLPAREKEAVMAEFRANRLQVLLSTSLIEVGVDVANATIMLVENAELFGLAQLHQLRGRIGRGAHDSHCILVASARTREAQQRLRVLEQTTDGFVIAEADLKLRGPGEMLGLQQSGVPNFRFGNLISDLDLINKARELVAQTANTTFQTLENRSAEVCDSKSK